MKLCGTAKPREFEKLVSDRALEFVDEVTRAIAAMATELSAMVIQMPRSSLVETVEFKASDGLPLNFVHCVSQSADKPEPVIVVHGAGVRSRIFQPPVETTFVDSLIDANYDVWLLNWRASIDLPPNQWTLEDAAVHDHPAAVRTVLERTGASSLKAVIHCQGSTSFMMSVVAGLLPEVSLVVSNAVALHPMVPRLSTLKSRYATEFVARYVKYLNPQWGLSAPRGWPTADRLLGPLHASRMQQPGVQAFQLHLRRRLSDAVAARKSR